MNEQPGQPTTLARVRVVFSSSGFRRLFATRAASQVGDGLFQLAAADLLLFDKPGPNPALTLTILSVVTLVPFSAIAPFVGVFIDRWNRRTILQIVPLVRAVLAATIALGVGRGEQGAAFYLVVLAVLSANRFFLATMSAVLPQLVDDDDLLVANSVASTGGSISNVVGLGLGAALASVMGGTQTAGVASLAFVAGAVAARGIPVHGASPSQKGALGDEVRRVVAEMIAGAVRLRESRRATFALATVSVNQLLIGAMTGATAYYFIRTLGLGVGAVSSLLAVLAIGIGVGVAVVPAVARRVPRERLIPMSFAVAAIVLVAVGATLSRAAVVAGGVFVGLAYAMIKIPVDTIVQEEMPDSFRGRAFAAYDMLFNVARVSGTAVAAAMVGAGVSPAASVVLVGAAYALAAWRSFHAATRLPPHRHDDAGADVGTAEPAPFVPPTIEMPPTREEPPMHDEPPTREEPLVHEEPLMHEEPPATGIAALFPVGELVTVRTSSGYRAGEEPRAIGVGGREIPVDAVEWRAVEERVGGERRLVFVVRVAGVRVRLVSSQESSRWEVERVLAANTP